MFRSVVAGKRIGKATKYRAVKMNLNVIPYETNGRDFLTDQIRKFLNSLTHHGFGLK